MGCSQAERHFSKKMLHFGFGHGPRFCPGRSLSFLEVGLVVGALVKIFKFKAVHDETGPSAGQYLNADAQPIFFAGTDPRHPGYPPPEVENDVGTPREQWERVNGPLE